MYRLSRQQQPSIWDMNDRYETLYSFYFIIPLEPHYNPHSTSSDNLATDDTATTDTTADTSARDTSVTTDRTTTEGTTEVSTTGNSYFAFLPNSDYNPSFRT